MLSATKDVKRLISEFHICLVTPAHLSTNPRLVKEADALVSAGYRVTVVACRFIAWADKADTEFKTRSWHVYKVSFGPLANLTARIVQGLRRRASMFLFRVTGALAPTAFHPAVPALTRSACNVEADLYIAHNLAALPAAQAAAKMHKAKLGFDAEDFHRGELTDGPDDALWLRLTKTIEEAYLPHCDYVTAASPGIARAYARVCGIDEPTVILNVFPKTDAPARVAKKSGMRRDPTLYWFSQTLGANRGLETLIKAVSQSHTRPMLCLRGNPSPDYVETLRALAELHGVAGRLRFMSPASPGEMVHLAAQYDIGIASEPGHPHNNRLALSNKLFTFLLAGVPVLASATEAQSELAAKIPGAVFLYSPADSKSLALHIDALFQCPERLARASEAAWQAGQARFNWDMEKMRFLGAIQRCLDNPAKSSVSKMDRL